MAKVPVSTTRQVEDRPISPGYQSAEAPIEAFGGGAAGGMTQAANALENAGNLLGEAVLRINRRNDAVRRTKDAGDFANYAAEQLRTFQTTEDFADPEVVTKYAATIREQMNKMLTDHGGSKESVSLLSEQMETVFARSGGQAAQISFETGRKKVEDQIGGAISSFASEVSADPSTFGRKWNDFATGLRANYRDVLTDTELSGFERRAAESAVINTIEMMMVSPGGVKTAQDLISSRPEVMALVGAEARTKILKTINIAAAEERKAARETKVLSPGSIMVDGNGKVVARAGFAPKEPTQTAGQKAVEAIALYEKLTGQPAGEQQIGQLLGMGSGTQSLQGKVADFTAAYTKAIGTPPSNAELVRFLGVDAPEGQKSVGEQVQDIQAVRAANGQKPLTDEQLNILQGLRGKELSLKDKLDQAAAVYGPMSKDEIAKVGGFLVTKDDEKNTFSRGAMGDASNVFVDISPRFSSGLTTETEDRTFLQAVANYTTRRMVPNPDTGVLEEVRNELPAYVQSALQQRGFAIPTSTVTGPGGAAAKPAGAPAAAPAAPAAAAPGGSTTPFDPQGGDYDYETARANGMGPTGDGTSENAGHWGSVAPVAPDEAKRLGLPEGSSILLKGRKHETWDKAVAAEKARGSEIVEKDGRYYSVPKPAPAKPKVGDSQGRTVYDLADMVTGPTAKIGQAVGRTPGLGGPAPEMTQAQAFVDQQARDLIRTLQNNPRYAEGERQAIEKEIDISGEMLRSPESYRQRIIGIDDALEARLRSALKTASSDRVSREERQQAMNIANAISQFRENLLPPRVKSVSEAKDLPPGTRFLDPKGVIRKVPEAAQGSE